MKKWCIISALLPILLLNSCTPTDPVINSLGANCTGTIWREESFQDYTDYGKFSCKEVTATQLKSNSYFDEITADDLPLLQGYLADFETWIVSMEDEQPPKIHYDFSADAVNPGDYFCLLEKGTRQYENYDLYYFDLETQTLYYFHNDT